MREKFTKEEGEKKKFQFSKLRTGHTTPQLNNQKNQNHHHHHHQYILIFINFISQLVSLSFHYCEVNFIFLIAQQLYIVVQFQLYKYGRQFNYSYIIKTNSFKSSREREQFLIHSFKTRQKRKDGWTPYLLSTCQTIWTILKQVI